ncbi:voltage-gated potassium channel [Desulfocicer vacuolatum DSM 3385]|uniref:Voltage-gated potassium channel n=1 Tax=Desulfocicer vacuolatum DSM 3385 TaxID=1121400 RepID=A0A1W1ZU18_9BACT|nr:potassium channel protein [Desulfocicer vacuolatum]SMC51866.1 voltage-gated potassium channel [Desulfocicer vacuolatum DSM 3385]
MNKIQQITLAVIISSTIFAIGIIGYMGIEKWSFIDAAYMTAITLSTVGFSEVNGISTAGRVFTIFLIFAGVGYFLYLAGVIMQFVVEGEIKSILGRKILDTSISKLKNHYIVCGYGRIGRILCDQLKDQAPNLVVLEKNDALNPLMDKDRVLYLNGDASEESLLIKAGIHKAKHLIAALATDMDNVFLVLTARQLNPGINIMARAGSNNVKSKLLAAGANRVESPYDIGAVSMGLKLLRPSVSSFLDIALSRKKKAIQIEETLVSENAPLANIMLKDSGIRQNFDLIIIAIRKKDGEMIFNPSFDTRMESGDTVIVMGQHENLTRFEAALNPK